jgi:hypothetical protein
VKLSGFESLATALEAAGVRHLVAGGLAVGAHGSLRFTKDVDIVVQLIPDNIERMYVALGSLGYQPSVPITMQQFSNSDARALVAPLRDQLAIRFVSRGTLIQMKQQADRPQDRADIEQLLAEKLAPDADSNACDPCANRAPQAR